MKSLNKKFCVNSGRANLDWHCLLGLELVHVFSMHGDDIVVFLNMICEASQFSPSQGPISDPPSQTPYLRSPHLRPPTSEPPSQAPNFRPKLKPQTSHLRPSSLGPPPQTLHLDIPPRLRSSSPSLFLLLKVWLTITDMSTI